MDGLAAQPLYIPVPDSDHNTAEDLKIALKLGFGPPGLLLLKIALVGAAYTAQVRRSPRWHLLLPVASRGQTLQTSRPDNDVRTPPSLATKGCHFC